ncbi:hypothetical protein BT67DRAFT_10639 [Trichocladium antarcticum]|uniref:Uncharacterized protein n=1 Tax=Trichocladium antarcticum TaxID=1450529 RepID=A0AAN6ZHV6_9PEZI|nr:hypothetical protein BT67DRAFT_10639 [Trichocladium antarcticum]
MARSFDRPVTAQPHAERAELVASALRHFRVENGAHSQFLSSINYGRKTTLWYCRSGLETSTPSPRLVLHEPGDRQRRCLELLGCRNKTLPRLARLHDWLGADPADLAPLGWHCLSATPHVFITTPDRIDRIRTDMMHSSIHCSGSWDPFTAHMPQYTVQQSCLDLPRVLRRLGSETPLTSFWPSSTGNSKHIQQWTSTNRPVLVLGLHCLGVSVVMLLAPRRVGSPLLLGDLNPSNPFTFMEYTLTLRHHYRVRGFVFFAPALPLNHPCRPFACSKILSLTKLPASGPDTHQPLDPLSLRECTLYNTSPRQDGFRRSSSATASMGILGVPSLQKRRAVCVSGPQDVT